MWNRVQARRGPDRIGLLVRAFRSVRARRRSPGIAVFVVLTLTGATGAEESPVATLAVSASPAASYVGERPIEGVMHFRGRKYLLTLRGVAGPASSVGSVFGLVRARDIAGPYTPADGGLRNPAGVTIRLDPPLEIVRDGRLQIDVASRIYPKVSTGQGNDLE